MKKILTAGELSQVIGDLEKLVDEQREEAKVTSEGLAKMLIVATCDEMTAIWQYLVARHYIKGNGRLNVIDEYDEHLEDEWRHLKDISDRLEQIGGKPVFDIDEINELAHSWDRVTMSDPREQLLLLYKAEENAKSYYRDIIRYAKALGDEVTVALFHSILKDETDHSFELSKILEEM